MVIVVFWWIFYFASLATVEMLGRVFGIGFDWVESLPNLVRVCLNPPTVLTLIGFILFIRYERINHAPPPVGFTDARGKGYGGYRASALHMKNLPTVRTFRY